MAGIKNRGAGTYPAANLFILNNCCIITRYLDTWLSFMRCEQYKIWPKKVILLALMPS